MKALVVGLGSIGRRHARNWAALGLGEVWVCRQTGAPQPEPLGVDQVRVWTSLDEALAAGPDVVLVTNPTSLHVETARRAIQAGCHVLVEKPLGSSLEGVAELLEAATAHQRVLAVGYNLRCHPGLARLRTLLQGGAIGVPRFARAEMGEYLPGWHPWEDYRQSYSARRDLGGGPILTFSHELDALCWLLGRPRQVLAMAGHVSRLEIETEDVAEISLRFASDAIGSLHVDYLRQPPQRSIEVVGDDGVLRWEYDANRLLRYAPATRQWQVEEGDPRFTRNQMFCRELQQLVDAIQGAPRSLLADGTQAAAVLAIALAAQRSAADGRAVDLEAMPEPVTGWLNSLDGGSAA